MRTEIKRTKTTENTNKAFFKATFKEALLQYQFVLVLQSFKSRYEQTENVNGHFSCNKLVLFPPKGQNIAWNQNL